MNLQSSLAEGSRNSLIDKRIYSIIDMVDDNGKVGRFSPGLVELLSIHVGSPGFINGRGLT